MHIGELKAYRTKEEPMPITFRINGQGVSSDAPPQTPLLWIIREQVKPMGTKFGCGAGLCGACMRTLHDKRAFSCQTQLSEVARPSCHDD